MVVQHPKAVIPGKYDFPKVVVQQPKAVIPDRSDFPKVVVQQPFVECSFGQLFHFRPGVDQRRLLRRHIVVSSGNTVDRKKSFREKLLTKEQTVLCIRG